MKKKILKFLGILFAFIIIAIIGIFIFNKGIIYGRIGIYFLEKGNTENAIKYLDKGINYTEDGFTKGFFYFNKGIIFYDKGNKKKGIEFLDKSLELGFKLEDIYLYKGKYSGLIGKYKESILFFNKYINSYNSKKILTENDKIFLSEAFYFRGGSYVSLGKYTQGIKDYDKAIKLNKKMNRFHFYYKGMALKLMGKESEGNKFLDKSKKLGGIK